MNIALACCGLFWLATTGVWATSKAESLIISSNRVRLGTPGTLEWTSFANDPATARSLELRFDARSNAAPATLLIRQDDVRQDWAVELNGRRLGKLFLMEADLWHTLAVPPGLLKERENRLAILAPRENDDIVIGEVRIDYRSVDAALSEGWVEVDVQERPSHRRLPSRITIVDSRGALAPLSVAKTSTNILATTAARPGVIYAAEGRSRIGLPAGDYTIYASRGFEWSVASRKLRVRSGKVVAARLELKHEVLVPGWVSCDTHGHTLTHSGHGDATLDERLITLAGEGLALPIATDHNFLAEYDVPARRLGLDQWFTSVTGDEVTTAAGHFNIFPVELGSRVPDFRISDWPTLMKSFRATPGVRVVVLNHPRNIHNGFQPFAATNFNAVTGDNKRGPEFGFDALEVLNSSAQQTDYQLVLRDWFALLNHGYRITGVGSSDGHDVSRYIIGQGRTYIQCAGDTPGRVEVATACSNLVAGRALVSMGLLARLTVNRAFGAGELAINLADTVHVSVEVFGPSWVSATNVVLFANGMKVHETAINPRARTGPAGVKATVNWSIPRPAHDVHLVAVATGPGVTAPYWAIPRPYQPASPHWEGRVIGITNPVWLDADNDRQFTPARAYAREILRQAGNDPARFVPLLASHDEPVSSQAASLYVAAGHSMTEAALITALRNAAPHVKGGFAAFAEAAK